MLTLHQDHVQKQTISISQNTIQACSILSMSIDELYSYIQDAVLDNPLISFESIPPLSPYGKAIDLYSTKEAIIEFAENLSTGTGVFHSTTGLKEHLILQIPSRTDKAQRRILCYLINSLDEDGYYRDPPEEAIRILGCTWEEHDAALAILQHMDPPGIGARDLRECLLLQLEHRLPEDTIPYHIIRDHFVAFTKNQQKSIAKALHCDLQAVYAAVETISQLNPRPAGLFAAANTRYIIPDITIAGYEDDFTITLNREVSFDIKVDDSYDGSFDYGNDDHAKRWLKEKKRQAAMLQLFVQKRNSTLLLVCGEIFQAQKPFFYKGPEYLRPLKQKDIADALDCHESTVFRAVKGKYLACSWGVFPLTYFFSNLIECEDSFDPCNPKQMIISIVEHEDKRTPLSDSAIAQMLAEQGVQISRRTVAKYRDETGIPNVAMRKRFI